MSKAVLMSIRPEWVEKIHSGEKKWEVRTTMPKNVHSYSKVYNYETKNGGGRGVVVSEWWITMCHVFVNLSNKADRDLICKNACLTEKQLMEYYLKSKKKRIYCWVVDYLKVYDKPKELSEFYSLSSSKCKFRERGHNLWSGRRYYKCTLQNCMCDMKRERIIDCECFESKSNSHKLTKAPQSWCYVEEL